MVKEYITAQRLFIRALACRIDLRGKAQVEAGTDLPVERHGPILTLTLAFLQPGARMNSMFGRVALLVGCLAWAGCDLNTEPQGTPSTVTVLAYVDADGSGTLSAGDDPLSGAQVTLSGRDGAPQIEGTVGADGRAVFSDVPPGSYTVSLNGSAPQGAVLATGSQATVIAPFSGATVEAEFRYAFLPGTLTGRVFRDDNSDNQYTPGRDTPAPNLPVVVYAGAGTAGTPLLDGVTDAEGRFNFAGLRPGEYTVVLRPFSSIRLVGDSVRTVTVRPNTPAELAVRFTGSLRISIEEAKSLAQGSAATVEGVVTAPQGVFGAQNIYIQDRTDGIQVFRVPTGMGLQVGDSVRVSGVLGNFNEELQLTSAEGNPLVVERLGAGTIPAPRLLTVAQFNARTYEGELVRLPEVRVDSILSGTTAFTVVGRGPAGERIEVRVSGSGTGISRDEFRVGSTYSITGLAGSFRGTPQLKPRTSADIEAVEGALPVSQARTSTLGDTVTVVGVVTAPQGTYNVASVYLQDPTGGIQVFNVPTDANLRLGDSIRVTGLLGVFSGDLQIVRFSSTQPPLIVRLGTGPVPAPRLVTGAEVVARTHEGMLVRANGLTVVSVSGTSSHNVVVRDAAGTEFTVRVDALVANAGLPPSTWEVGAVYDVTGIQTGFTSGGQIKPRSAADVVRR